MSTLENVFEIIRSADLEISSEKNASPKTVRRDLQSRTKALLESYRYLRTHQKLMESAAAPPRCREDRFEKALAAYEALCLKSRSPEDLRRWRALQMRYLTDARVDVQRAAKALHVDQRTLYRDLRRAITDLAVLIYGAEALNKEIGEGE